MEAINETLIMLIPKVKLATKLKDFRSISLCHVTYKAITKNLALRLRSLLENMISTLVIYDFQHRFLTDVEITNINELNVNIDFLKTDINI